MTPVNQIKPVVGMEVEIRGLRWSVPYWEFDCPTAIIMPVCKFFENGCSLEYALESVLIDACIEPTWKGEDPDGWSWRNWPYSYLRRKFYRKDKGVEKLKQRVRFVLDEHGELSWEDL